MKITGFTCWLVEVDPGLKFIWRNGLQGSHGDIRPGTKPQSAILRMKTDEGFFSSIEMARGASVMDLVARRYHSFTGKSR